MNADFKLDFLFKLVKIERFHFSIGEYVIAGSGPLAIRNLRLADDVDIVVSIHAWEELKKQFHLKSEYNLLIEGIDIWGGQVISFNYKRDEIIKAAEIIENYPFLSLQETLAWKKWLNREKDKKDVQMIEEYLKK